jgi:cytochrome c peroxidase
VKHKSSCLLLGAFIYAALAFGTSAKGGHLFDGQDISDDRIFIEVYQDNGVTLPDAITDADYVDVGNSASAKVELGKALYWDKILSGNMNISCATCHHSLTDTGDGLSLPVGEGGRGLGIARDTGTDEDRIVERVPRNAPPIFNRGAIAFVRMFHDGRVEAEPAYQSGFKTPVGFDLPQGLETLLAAQAMFPVTSAAEMAGRYGDNPVATAAALGDLAGPNGVWAQLAERLREIPGYVTLFQAAYPGDIIAAEDITFVHAANAIGAYEATAFRADKSPFDAYLRGDHDAMGVDAKRGMRLFYGKAGCSDCHSGKFQTDMQFHGIAMPQIGPGKEVGLDNHDDFGREQITGDPADHRKFLTPSLRNVALTGPWGHAGGYNTLRAAVEHHLDTDAALASYDPSQIVLPLHPDLDAIDLHIYNDPSSWADLAASSELQPKQLRARELDDLLSFLYALTDRNSLDLRRTAPRSVPSGLPVAD